MNYRFFDSSALVKRFIDEKESDEVDQACEGVTIVVSIHTYSEVGSAIGRAYVHGRLTEERCLQALNSFQDAWTELLVIQYDSLLMMHARALFPLYDLRAGDVVQLASAVVARQALQVPFEFYTYDKKLWATARIHGFTPLPADLLTR